MVLEIFSLLLQLVFVETQTTGFGFLLVLHFNLFHFLLSFLAGIVDAVQMFLLILAIINVIL